MYPDYLIHYGVKGMKWGVRKKEEQNKLYNKIKKEDFSFDTSPYLTKKHKNMLRRADLKQRKANLYETKQEEKFNNKTLKKFGGKKPYQMSKEEFARYADMYSANYEKHSGKLKKLEASARKSRNKTEDKIVNDLLGKYKNAEVNSIYVTDTFKAGEIITSDLRDRYKYFSY